MQTRRGSGGGRDAGKAAVAGAAVRTTAVRISISAASGATPGLHMLVPRPLCLTFSHLSPLQVSDMAGSLHL